MRQDKFARVRRQTLADQVAESLLSYIGAERLKPGDLLPPESKLAEEFGVSRPVIREAMKSLEGKGVTMTVNGRGAVVRTTDGEPLRFFFERAVHLEARTVVELMEVRYGIETRCAALAAQRRTAEDVEALTETITAMRANLGSVEAYAELDLQFHLRIAAATGNSMLYFLVESIRQALKNSIIEGLHRRPTLSDLEFVQRLHEDVFAAIKRQQVQKALRAMVRHFDEAVLALVDDPEPASESELRPAEVPTGPAERARRATGGRRRSD